MKHLLYILCLFVLSCDELTLPVFGCTDDIACNYNEDASNDDGSCEYEDCEDSY